MGTDTHTTATTSPQDGPVTSIPTTVRKVVTIPTPLVTGTKRKRTAAPTATLAARPQAGTGGATRTRVKRIELRTSAPRADPRRPLQLPPVAVLPSHEGVALHLQRGAGRCRGDGPKRGPLITRSQGL